MAELFKNIYNQNFFNRFLPIVKTVLPSFDIKSFEATVFNSHWEAMELKQRMRHITHTLKQQFPSDFKVCAEILLNTIEQLQQKGIKEESIEYMFFPDFIEVYGLEHFEVSVNAFENITQFTSCEFAVRPFIIQYKEKMLAQMSAWSKHPHYAVRRLATEGCRPRLPWAMAIPFLKEDPSAILPILSFLKDDVAETVRRSVANNLNDISKDHPEIVIKLAKQWYGASKELNWVVKHACRTLLKQGNQEAMLLFGYSSIENIILKDFQINIHKVTFGQFLEFSFSIHNTHKLPAKIRLEYGVYYQKANGTLSKKVYKISEKEYPERSQTPITRRQPFKPITTRKFYPGLHRVAVIINGHEFESLDFELEIRN